MRARLPRLFRNWRPPRPLELRFEPLPAGSATASAIALPLTAGRAAAEALVREPDQTPRREALRDAFTPTRPLVSAERLAGRDVQLARILRALREQMAHVALYAERGHGKTSLANMVTEALRAEGVVVARFTCAATTDFGGMLRGLLRDLPPSLLAAPVEGATRREGCEAALPDGAVEPRDLLQVPDRLAGALARRQLVMIVDEFDRVSDPVTRTAVADSLKQVADRGLPLSFVLVGVSDSLEQLLGYHPSVQRNLVGVPLPLLAPEAMERLLRQGARAAGLVLSSGALAAMVSLARGMPYVGQLLGLHAGHSALGRGSAVVLAPDLEAAVGTALEEADPRIIAAYADATGDGRDGAMIAALRGIAGGRQDPYGRFRAEPALDEGGLLTVAGWPVPAALWSRLLQVPVVRPCIGVGAGTYTFSEATFGHYVLMQAAREAGFDASKAA